MTSYPETLTVKKLIKMQFFIMKIYYISSSNDPNITRTKNHIWGQSHFKNLSPLYLFIFQGDSDPQMHIRLIKKIKASSQGLIMVNSMLYKNCSL
jgi:hypothetical protein